MSNALDSDGYAAALGLIASSSHPSNINELQRMYRVHGFIQSSREKNDFDQDVIWNRLCATYLPALVDRFLSPPQTSFSDPNLNEDIKLDNAYSQMLGAVQHSPYFLKYLRSTKPIALQGKKKLANTIAQRFVLLGPRWDTNMRSTPQYGRPEEYFEAAADSYLQLLATVLALCIKEEQATIISAETKTHLKPILLLWLQNYCNEPTSSTRQYLAEKCDCVLRLLYAAEDPKFSKGVLEMRRSIKSLDVCGLPGCNSKFNLKVCGKCKTLCYCSPEHQKKHWGGIFLHKANCHATEY